MILPLFVAPPIPSYSPNGSSESSFTVSAVLPCSEAGCPSGGSVLETPVLFCYCLCYACLECWYRIRRTVDSEILRRLATFSSASVLVSPSDAVSFSNSCITDVLRSAIFFLCFCVNFRILASCWLIL